MMDEVSLTIRIFRSAGILTDSMFAMQEEQLAGDTSGSTDAADDPEYIPHNA